MLCFTRFNTFAVYVILCYFIVERTVAQDVVKQPHIVIILADDLGFDDISFRGSREFITPNIDALAYHGKILDRLYAPAICTPSRGALMTARYPIHTGTQHFVISNEEAWGLPTNITTMPEIFRSAGYSTQLVGKWHLGFAKREYTPTYRGFDYHYGIWGGYVDYYQRRAIMPGRNFSMGYDFRRNMELECGAPGTYITDLFTTEAERIINANSGSKPLFLLLSHVGVHASDESNPLQAPEEEIAKFAYIKNPARRIYAAMVSRLDRSVGRVVRALERANMLDDSIIMFYSDNGGPTVGLFQNTASNWPLKGQKNTPWEGGVRVAGAIWSPLLKGRGALVRQPMYVGDWLPTLAAAANIPLDSDALGLDGVNMWPELSANAATVATADAPAPAAPIKLPQREIVHSLDDVSRTVSLMHGVWKYVNGTTANGQYDNWLTYRELYETDPRDENYVAEVRNSLASQALRHYDTQRLNMRRMERLRREAAIQCGTGVQRSCNALIEECLYNIILDPCERNNLAAQPEYAHVMAHMRARINEHRRFAWPLANRGSQESNDPGWHRCTWTNFVQEPPSEVKLTCGYTGPPCELDAYEHSGIF